MSAQKEDYLYLSSLLRAREKNMLTRDRAERMLDAPGFEDCAKLLTDSGYEDMSQMNIKQIEDALDVAHPTVVGLVGRLESAGFIECCVDENDRRYKHIRLLPKAYAIEQEIRQDRKRSEQILTAGMSPEEAGQLCRLLERVYANADQINNRQEDSL